MLAPYHHVFLSTTVRPGVLVTERTSGRNGSSTWFRPALAIKAGVRKLARP